MKTYVFQMKMIVFVLASCQKELDFNDTVTEQNTIAISDEKKIENGRFIFSSIQSLETTIEKLQNEDVEKIEREFNKFYTMGFRSHTPFVNEDDDDPLLEVMSADYTHRYGQYKNSSFSEDEEADSDGFISDPFLASFVNNNNEIIINDTLYKFTEDKGLFFAHIKDSTFLMDYVSEVNKTNSILTTNTKGLKSTSYTPKAVEPCMERVLYGGYSRINSRVSRYVRPILDDDCFDNPINPPSPPPPAISEDEKLNNIINNLNLCDGRPVRGNWVQNIFGKSYACRDYFGKKHRIKTEFWDQNWGFYKSVGILTKTQRRRFGIWWASKSDEIHLGINYIKLRYNFSQPQINSYSHPELFPKNSYQNPIYMWDGKFHVKTYEILGKTFAKAQLDLPSGKLPFFDFGNKELLNIYIHKVYKKGKYNLNLTTQDITSQGNIKGLYKMGIDFLKSSGITNSGNVPTFAVTYQKDYNNIETVYFAERFSEKNENKIKHKFYSSAQFTIGYAWNDDPKPILAPDGKQIGIDYSGTGKFKVKPVKENFRDYTQYKLDFYGMARRGSTWKGNRLIREDKK